MYQWLGALVSPAWWNDAHVNKALVGYLSASTAIKVCIMIQTFAPRDVTDPANSNGICIFII
jgi:hypothetical protein